jgi:hypothetical protein
VFRSTVRKPPSRGTETFQFVRPAESYSAEDAVAVPVPKSWLRVTGSKRILLDPRLKLDGFKPSSLSRCFAVGRIDKIDFIAKGRDLLDVAVNGFLPSRASTELCSTPRF